jgi:hypothetical protein
MLARMTSRTDRFMGFSLLFCRRRADGSAGPECAQIAAAEAYPTDVAITQR